MSVLLIAIVGGAIATGFYYINRDTATSKKRLRESTAMVFILSSAVLLLARFLGLGSPDEGPQAGGGEGAPVTPSPLDAAAGGHVATMFDYAIGGEPPF